LDHSNEKRYPNIFWIARFVCGKSAAVGPRFLPRWCLNTDGCYQAEHGIVGTTGLLYAPDFGSKAKAPLAALRDQADMTDTGETRSYPTPSFRDVSGRDRLGRRNSREFGGMRMLRGWRISCAGLSE
jgi:hypothetical protein